MSSSKVFVVTGAGRGIGREVCKQLLARGHHALAAVRRAEAIEPLQQELGASAVVTACDVREAAQVEHVFALADERFGRLDGLVNNAATVQPIGRIGTVSPHEWREALMANLYGPYLCIASALPRLVARGGGVVVNLSSGAARRPMEGWSAYCTTKAGLAMLTRSVYEEWHAQGVFAVGIAPGTVDTDMQAAIRHSGINPVSRIDRSTLSPPEFPARMIVALLEDAARQFAGQEVDVRDEAFKQACEAWLERRQVLQRDSCPTPTTPAASPNGSTRCAARSRPPALRWLRPHPRHGAEGLKAVRRVEDFLANSIAARRSRRT